MPVVKMIKLHIDAIVELKSCAMYHIRLELQINLVLTQMLNVILDGDLDYFAYIKEKKYNESLNNKQCI